MALRPVVRFPDSTLRAKTREVVEITPEVRALVADMAETMYAKNGAGLAAIQVGALDRIFIIEASITGGDENDPPVVFINPTIEWLSDNGSGYIAHETKSLAREMGLEPRTTPVQSPQSNGMAEAFVRTIKRDYVRVSPIPDARTVMANLPLWFEHYNSLHPHKALGYRSPREFIASRQPG